MSFITTFLISLGLAMDAFAVAIGSGMALKKVKLYDAVLVATFFGGFQLFMPLIGWIVGLAIREAISSVDHWIAFLLLAFIGGKMIHESIYEQEGVEEAKAANPRNLYILLGLAVATSIDALAVGLSVSLLQTSIVELAVVIGIVTFVLSFAGVYIGNRVGNFCEKQVTIIGGVILIGIGVKILVEHLSAAG
ncbi:manganese efflux pump MntP [Laspinema olomoucense]|uniref:Putative manganese efflux pump MntP n=1 Tax=Laspinema olomoucense D3b TaxID=2953688 RepID=A0ABT2NF30_9CYAN|nr:MULTISPECIES: manganese efflux pump MntP family protein [unclassified Laspinema]MCT7972128.1 manganese efflux pump MntP family protein [Laspinema sp. D3d]MCT7981313.1 manganese efflux pump MntP family protein [Laspinema sp. D3b]MCT7990911.1 manganese efflux pump MntP family protein [Laspinema sp. D3a]MCT7993158.1 manganese efflux pump MntP family protein [Laspinema sp. D3c]